MLGELRIADFAIIDDLSVRFGPGFNVITGETGSGKSILIDALSLLLGARASADMVRTGKPQAEIEGLFEAPFDPALGDLLDSMGLAFDGQTLLIRRIVVAGGKSRAYINGSLAAVGQLADLAPRLVDICGQHEHQTLMSEESQRALVDRYGDLLPLREEVGRRWTALREASMEMKRLAELAAQRAERESFLRFQHNELKEVEISEEEEETLLADRKRLANLERLHAVADEALSSLGGKDSLAAQVDRLVQRLEGAAESDGALAQPIQTLEQARVALDEASYAISAYRNKLPSDPGSLDRIEERLRLYKTLKKKYGGTVSAVLEKRDEVAEALERLDDYDFHLAKAEKALRLAEESYFAEARGLSAQRKEAARRMETGVIEQLGDLSMERVRFQANFRVDREEKDRAGADGVDEIRFLISPNPGEAMKPMDKTASGGELSRILLAVRRAVADRSRAPRSYVFDEVDTGIGGAVAESVGAKLAEIAQSDQVLCVTHHPQLAVWADTHFHVAKKVVEERTRTEIAALDREARTLEIARMLAGAEITPTTMEHAREMLEAGIRRPKAV